MTKTDAEKIASVLARVSHYVDAKKWAELRALYVDEVEVDYTSLFGGEARRTASAELVDGWKTALSPVITHHLFGPAEIEVDGGAARAECHVRASHYATADEWVVIGHYVFELTRTGSEWQIRRMVLQASHQTGNEKLLEEAAR